MFLHFQLVMYFSSPCRSCLMERESASMDEVGNNYCLPFTCRVSGSTPLLSVCNTCEQHDSAGNKLFYRFGCKNSPHSYFLSLLFLFFIIVIIFMFSSRDRATINCLKGQSIISDCVLDHPCLIV